MASLLKKSLDATPVIYLTLISIIQSMPLLLLADKLDFGCEVPFEFVVRMLMYCAAIQMIVITWHEYALSTIYFTWTVGFSDTWIPMLLGLCEYEVVKYAEFASIRSFAVWITLFVLLAFIAFLNRDRKMRDRGANGARLLVAGMLTQTRLWMGAALVEFAIGTFFVWRYPTEWPAAVVLVVVNGSFVFQAVRCQATYKPLIAVERRESLADREVSGAATVH